MQVSDNLPIISPAGGAATSPAPTGPAASTSSNTPGERREAILSDWRVLVRRLFPFRSLARLLVKGGRGMTGRPSAEELCRKCIAILDQNLRDDVTVRQLRNLFDIPDPDPAPVGGKWPPLRAAD